MTEANTEQATVGWQWPAILVMAAVAAVAFMQAGGDRMGGDELDIVRPALAYMSGHILTDVKYPSFPFYFYGVFLGLFSSPEDHERNWMVARAVHAGIGGANLIVMYLLACRLFTRGWALLTAILFQAVPVVLYSAALVKTENLQVLELLLTLLAILKLNEDPSAPRWHVAAGAAAAASLATKLNLFPAFLYGLNLLYLHRRDGALPWRGAFQCAAAFVAMVLIVWTNLWVFDEIVAGWQKDQYFQPNASIFRAIDEWDAFPYGRYSSFFVSTLPIAVGWPLVILSGLSVATRSRWLLSVMGVGTLVYLLVMLTGTLLRIAHTFTPLLPFFPIAAVTSLRWLATRWGKRGPLVATAATLVTLGYTGYLAAGIPAMRHAEKQRDALMAKYGDEPGFVTLMESDRPVKDRETIRQRVARLKPSTVLIINSYFLNMCKYRHNEMYRDNCTYYRELLSDKTPFRVVQSVQAKIPGSALQLDPEVREMTYHLLQRPGA